MKSVTLQNTNILADIRLVSYDPVNKDVKFTELDLSTLTYFEIEDNLYKMGLEGNVTYPNWGSMLNFLDLEKPSKVEGPAPEQYISIELKGEEAEVGKENLFNGYNFMAAAKANDSLTKSAVDVKQTLNFDEHSISILKTTGYKQLVEFGNPPLNSSSSNPKAITDLIQSTGEYIFTKNGDFFINKIKEPIHGRHIKFKDFAINRGSSTRDPSIFTMIRNIVNATYSGKQSGVRVLFTDSDRGYRLVNLRTAPQAELEVAGPTQNGEKLTVASDRRLELNYLFTDKHIEFLKQYKESSPSGDFTEVYLEEFVIAPNEDTTANTNLDNKVEEYSLSLRDNEALREEFWGTYEYSSQDPSAVSILKAEFNFFVNVFEKMLGKGTGIKSNLPKIDLTKQRRFNQDVFTPPGLNADGDVADDSAFKEVVRMKNVILNSFVLANDQILLTVKGKLYRKPGKFITVKSDFNKTKEDELFFITNVKHIISNGSYKNEITATRFLASGDYKERDVELSVAEDSPQFKEKKEAAKAEAEKANRNFVDKASDVVDDTPLKYVPGLKAQADVADYFFGND